MLPCHSDSLATQTSTQVALPTSASSTSGVQPLLSGIGTAQPQGGVSESPPASSDNGSPSGDPTPSLPPSSFTSISATLTWSEVNQASIPDISTTGRSSSPRSASSPLTNGPPGTFSVVTTTFTNATTPSANSTAASTTGSSVEISSQPASSAPNATISSVSPSHQHTTIYIIIFPVVLCVVLAIVAGFFVFRRRRRSQGRAIIASAPITPVSPLHPPRETFREALDSSKSSSRVLNDSGIPDNSSYDPYNPTLSTTSVTSWRPQSHSSEVVYLIDHDYSTRADNGRLSLTSHVNSSSASRVGHHPPSSPAHVDPHKKAQHGDARARQHGLALPATQETFIDRDLQHTDSPPVSSTPDPFVKPASHPPSPPFGTPAHQSQIIISHPAPLADRNGEERVVVVPWTLGERLLAFLANTPPSGLEQHSECHGSETLPAYTPRRRT
ncbi:hypothetical protein BC628DRAFT_138136 [Trametes gibbosa]|nr:hypothetical protein BC628DRAFT_138136 [Trametes gibbosa]